MAIIVIVTIIVGFMSYKTYDFPMHTHIGSGLASAGAFVFIFLGFDGAKGFMTKTWIADIAGIGGPAYGEDTHGRNYKNRVEIVTKRTYVGDTMVQKVIDLLMPFILGTVCMIIGIILM